MDRTQPGDPTFFRGGGGVAVAPRRIVRVVLAALVVGLGAAAVVLAVSARQQGARAGRLQAHGVPVEVTVTGCEGIGDGIGMGTQYYVCHGTYTYAGRTYREVIGGDRADHPGGTVLAGVTLPDEPTVVVTATSAAHSSPSADYTVPAVVGVAALVVAAGWAAGEGLRRKKGSGRHR